MMRHTGVKVVVVMGREEGRGATVWTHAEKKKKKIDTTLIVVIVVV